jgi:acetyltransferase-like isoleucine patch superfamily enzyme
MKYITLANTTDNEVVTIGRTSRITVSDNPERNCKVFYEDETFHEAKLTIKKFCSIAVGVSFYLGGNHNFNRVTTWLPMSLNRDQNSKNLLTKGDIVVNNDVWIGDEATILSGVTIGDGAIVGMNSVVTKNVEPYAIVAGNPAKVIRKRFDDKTIKKMLKFQWWNWKDSVIIQNSEKIFSEDLDRFFELCEEIYSNKEENYIK